MFQDADGNWCPGQDICDTDFDPASTDATQSTECVDRNGENCGECTACLMNFNVFTTENFEFCPGYDFCADGGVVDAYGAPCPS